MGCKVIRFHHLYEQRQSEGDRERQEREEAGNREDKDREGKMMGRERETYKY